MNQTRSGLPAALLFTAILLAAALSACGQTGPLYQPPQEQNPTEPDAADEGGRQ